MDFVGIGSGKSLLEGLEINENVGGWGPIAGQPLNAFDEVPYAHFDKKERCGRPADFSHMPSYYSQRMNYRDYRSRGGDGNAEFTYKHDAAEDSTFQLVDTSKPVGGGRGGGRGGRKPWDRNGQGGRAMPDRGGRVFQGASGRAGSGGRGNQGPQVTYGGRGGRGGRFGIQGPGSGRGGRGGPGGRGGFRRDRKLDRLSSVAVGSDWTQIEEFDLQQLLKLQANPPQTEDLAWCGHLDQYDEAYDKVSVRTARPLKRVDNRVFYAVTTAEDPVLERFAVEEVGNVFATDSILSHLMAAPRSLYSWDIVIQKTEGVIYLDKRENSIFDYLTVSETAHDPPTASEDMDEINFPDKLSLEATMINQNFSQQVLVEPSESTRKSVSVQSRHALSLFSLYPIAFFSPSPAFFFSPRFAVRAQPFLRGRRPGPGARVGGVQIPQVQPRQRAARCALRAARLDEQAGQGAILQHLRSKRVGPALCRRRQLENQD